jgi:hypothetical protein
MYRLLPGDYRPTKRARLIVKCTAFDLLGILPSVKQSHPFLDEWAEAEPRLHVAGKLAIAGQQHVLRLQRIANVIEAHPDRRHGAKVGNDVGIDIESGVDLAKIDTRLRLDQQPSRSPRGRQLGIVEVDHAAPLRPEHVRPLSEAAKIFGLNFSTACLPRVGTRINDLSVVDNPVVVIP